MAAKKLTLREIEARKQILICESCKDKIAHRLGVLGELEAVERAVLREFELRWLELEWALLEQERLPIFETC